MDKVGKWLLEDDWRAIAVSLAFIMLPVFYLPLYSLGSLVVTIVIALVSLIKGPKKGFVLLIWLALPLLASLYLRQTNIEYNLLFGCFISWLLASILRQQGSWVLVIETATLLAVVVVFVVHLLTPDITQHWENFYKIYYASVSQSMNMTTSSVELNQIANGLAPVGTGLALFNRFVILLLAVMLARFWQSILIRPGAFEAELLKINTGKVVLLSGAIMLVLGLLFKGPFIDCLPLFFIAFTFSGLAIFHRYLCVRAQSNPQIKVIAYLIFWLLMPIFILGFVILGVVNCRKSLSNKRESTTSIKR